jgi:putative drug exporter of the RND superfamily
VTTGDQGSFVPDDYESAQAERLAEEAFPEQTTTGALLVFSRADGGPLTDADQQRVAEVAQELSAAGIDRVAGVVTSPEALAPDGTVQLAQVALDGELTDDAVLDSVPALRERTAALLEGGELEMGMTGDAAMIRDSEEAFLDAERIVGIVTVVLIIGLLLLIFRSPVAALLPVLAVALVLATSSSLIAALYSALDHPRRG